MFMNKNTESNQHIPNDIVEEFGIWILINKDSNLVFVIPVLFIICWGELPKKVVDYRELNQIFHDDLWEGIEKNDRPIVFMRSWVDI